MIREFDSAIAGPTSVEGWRDAGRWSRLKIGRHSQPGCAKLGRKVIIAGGYSYDVGTLRSTEVVDLDSREVTAGGDLASPRKYFHLATIRRGGEEKMFAVAGMSNSSTYHNTVEKLVESVTWRKADSFLAQGRGFHGAVAVPRDYICPS